MNAKEKQNFCIIIGLSILLSVSEIFSIGILLPIINLFLDPSLITSSAKLYKVYIFFGIEDPLTFLTMLVIIAILLFLGKSVYGLIVFYRQQKYLAAINRRLAGDILSEYLRRPYEFHLANNSSILFKNINVEVGQFVSYILNPAITILSECVILCGVLTVAVYLYPWATVISVVSIGMVAFGLNQMFKRRLARYAENRSFFSEQYYKTVTESLQSVKEIKIFNVQDYFIKRFLYSFERYLVSFVKSSFIGSLPRYYMEALLFSGMLGIILISVYTRTDYKTIIPMIAILGVVAMRLMPSISKIVSSINSMHYSFNSLDMVYSVIGEIERMPQQNMLPYSAATQQKFYPIRLDHVSFRYASRPEDIVKDISLTIAPCSITAFIGETGTGKSTLIDIVMGLLLPQQGHLYYGNEKIDENTVDVYRTRIGYVPQTITLIDDTIAANIAFGIRLTDQEDEKLLCAVERAQLNDFIADLPEGLQTIVGERGVRISGGQRQRIGIARALYRDPEILILDEATSALDIHTEERVYRVVKELKKSVVMVTHRPTTIIFADMIYVLDKGCIRERGTYMDLNEKSQFLKNLSILGRDNE